MKNGLITAIEALERENVEVIIKNALQSGRDAASLLSDCRAGMRSFIKQYLHKECYLDAVLDAASIVNDTVDMLKNHVPDYSNSYIGKIVICTVMNDVHQNGRLMAVGILRAVGFEVFDLGYDVPPDRVIEALRDTNAPILALSGMVSSYVDSMKIIADEVRKAGQNPKIVVCGAMASEDLQRFVGADSYTKDAVEGANKFMEWVGADTSV